MHIAFPARSDATQHLIIPYAASRSPTGQSALQGLKLPHLERLLPTLTRVHVEQDGADIWVGGHTVTCISGTVRL